MPGLQTILYDREAIEHLAGYVECQERHQNDIHQIDHLLTGGYGSFLDCHVLSVHLCRHRLDHTGINLIELCDLGCHLTGLLINLVDGANL